MNKFAEYLEPYFLNRQSWADEIADPMSAMQIAQKMEEILCRERGVVQQTYLPSLLNKLPTHLWLNHLQEELEQGHVRLPSYIVKPTEHLEALIQIKLLMEKSDDLYMPEVLVGEVEDNLKIIKEQYLPAYFEALLDGSAMARMMAAGSSKVGDYLTELSNEQRAELMARRYACEVEGLLRKDLGMKETPGAQR